MKTFFLELKTSVLLTVTLVVVLCGAYPMVVWAIGQAAFHEQANGSLIYDTSGTLRGSKLLAQNFSSARYFHPRPSAAGTGYDATSSSGTNLGPTSAKLADDVKTMIAAYRAENHLTDREPVPADAVTRSASGLDPHISVANAQVQAKRVAEARGLAPEKIASLISEYTDERSLGVLGEPGVNVLKLNLALDQMR